MPQGRTREVKACITGLSLPQRLGEFEAMVEKNRGYQPQHPDGIDYSAGMTDLETILLWRLNRPIAWSALKGMESGDILLFYHGAASYDRARDLRRQAQRFSDEMLPIIDRALGHAERYGGTIFGCGLVGDDPYWQSHPEQGGYHFGRRYFAPIADVRIFERPLPANDFKDVVKISRFGAITTFKRDAFVALKQKLSANNTLPQYLDNAVMAR